MQHQKTLFRWSQQPSIRKEFPELKLLYHVGNERQCTPAQGAQLKLAGVRSGVPDLHLPVARGDYHSLYIELKADKGRTSEAQEWWMDELMQEGNMCKVCFGWEAAADAITNYLRGKNKNDGQETV